MMLQRETGGSVPTVRSRPVQLWYVPDTLVNMRR